MWLRFTVVRGTMTVALLVVATAVAAQQAAPRGAPSAASSAAAVSPEFVLGPEFVIGPEDILTVVFWREKEMSGDVTVRPDGKITLLLLGEIQAAGWTPSRLGADIQTAAAKYLADPNVTVIVRQINSRLAFITGEVNVPGAYPLTGPRSIMQLIALAGGVLEYAKLGEITVLREDQGQSRAFRFSYEDVARGRRLQQNFLLQPGDTVVVP